MSIKKSELRHLTRRLTQPEIVALAAYLVGGHTRAVDTEDVAVKAHSLAPEQFSWHKYKEQVDLDLVRRNLLHATKDKHGSLLEGSGREGWSLTPAGVEWARKANKSAGETRFSRSRADGQGGSIDEHRWRRERARITGTAAWARWVEEDMQIPVREARAVFRIDSYSVGRIRSLKINRTIEMFRGDPQIAPFLNCVAQVLNRSDDENDE